MSYINENFLLTNDIAIKLYHDYAKDLPIIDYHNHLVAEEIKKDLKYKNLTKVWLGHDHYKWRIMRACGVDESFITGDEDEYEKLKAFTSSLQRAYGNPVYHFSQLELKKYFNIDLLINEANTKAIWDQANQVLTNGLSVSEMIHKSNVEVLCTTDDPLDSLQYHFIKDGLEIRPTYRPDQALKLNVEWMRKLESITSIEIVGYEDLIKALEQRLIYFKEKGCLLSDHSLERYVFKQLNSIELNIAFKRLLTGVKLTEFERQGLSTEILIDLGKLYNKHGIIMQLHIGALRNNSSRQFKALGKDRGFDSMDDALIAQEISLLLSAIDATNDLGKTILYNINPRDNAMLATMAANFQGPNAMSKVQFGPAWWFNDHKEGMRNHLIDYANHGVLGNFIGMLTDSRSYLSFARHEYFRRVLCNLVGEWATNNEVPNDLEQLGSMVEDICYYNIKNYLGLGGRK